MNANRYYKTEISITTKLKNNPKDAIPVKITDSSNTTIKEVHRKPIKSKELCTQLYNVLQFTPTPTELCRLARKIGWRNQDNTSTNLLYYNYFLTIATYTKDTESKILEIIKEKDFNWSEDIFYKKNHNKLQKYKNFS